jgi:1-aminocyclopropane-1-carboxylate deaminase/D-cysteine desulfhydrase-like pyridoxal-dependent ACC family enzyme
VKTRKIEGVVTHMLGGGYDVLVTTVGNVTNLAHDLVPVLRERGLAAEILVADDPPLPTEERRRMFDGLGAEVRLLGPDRARVAVETLTTFNRRRRAGRRPFLALPSLAHPAAVVATARGFLEMVDQVDAMDVPPLDTVFITAASGTTLAGFALAESLLRTACRRPARVVGVQVYPGPARVWIYGLVRWTERRLGVREHLRPGAIELDASGLDGGFGRYSPGVAELCRAVKQQTGLDLDPVFGGKTWSVMESYLARGPRRGSTLYWHCGYTPDWERGSGAAPS